MYAAAGSKVRTFLLAWTDYQQGVEIGLLDDPIEMRIYQD
jgi:hypothetical protein